ncbi:MAG: NAD-binding protein [Syntrophobacteraceae bacterium]|nr:NAD-binding protein [Syntrophobacteraceae bacterium]
MKLLICGVGKVASHLLARLNEDWRVTLVDTSGEKLEDAMRKFPVVERVVTGDASSPVTLDNAGIARFEYVLLLTGNDKVNLAAAGHAEKGGVAYTMALVNEQENLREFERRGIRTLSGSALLAENIFHQLQDPRIEMTPLSMGQAEIMEIDVSHHVLIVGTTVGEVSRGPGKVVAIFRQNELVFPDPRAVIEITDRLVILGRSGLFKPVCDLMECSRPHFPLAYGQGLLLVLTAGSERPKMIEEAMHIARNTRVDHMTISCSGQDCGLEAELHELRKNFRVRVEEAGDEAPEISERLEELTEKQSYGLVVIDPVGPPLIKFLARPSTVSLAHALPCPLLVARNTNPYRRILVPFKATPKSRLALEVAIDLAKQIDGRIGVIAVQEPEFIRGPREIDWLDTVFKQVRGIAHTKKMDIEEIGATGNPVSEILKASRDFDLLVVGSTTRDKTLLSPHVGELLVREAPCSVLIVAK